MAADRVTRRPTSPPPPIVARPGVVVLCAAGGLPLTPAAAEALASELLMKAFDAREMQRLIETAPNGMIVKA